MTAEVAILNKLAVALAADSAVTTGFPGREKIFTSANKIFTLSKHAPVGIMIYGHVEFCSIPWEIIIKEYRRELGKKRSAHLADYVDDFKKFFCKSKFMNEYQQEITVLIACVAAYATLNDRIEKRSAKRTVKTISFELKEMEKFAQKFEGIDDLSNYSFRDFRSKYDGIVDSFIEDKENFFDVSIPVSCEVKFKKCVYLSLVLNMPTDFMTGLVIAGFGEEEIFPKLFELNVDGAVFDTPRMKMKIDMDISRSKETLFVGAFAQEEVVQSFMQGVDRDYQMYMSGMMHGFMKEYTKEILDNHTTYTDPQKRLIIKMIEKRLAESIDDFVEQLDIFSDENYVAPVKDVLRSAPKDELAHVAEALVSLTSLKRRVSGEKETVGGPVDVAVISKGDGFVWIKRKHYFAPELNHHFVRNYLEEGGRDEQKGE